MKRIQKILLCVAVLGILCRSYSVSVNKSGGVSTETWHDTVHITGNVSISGALTINPGSTIIFDSAYTLQVGWAAPKLNCLGTVASPVYFFCSKGQGSVSNQGTAIIKFCRFDNINIGSGSGNPDTAPPFTFEDNIVINGNVGSAWKPAIIRRNYIHQPLANNTIALRADTLRSSIIEDNIVFGGNFVTGSLAGIIRGNVFISLVIPPGGVTNDYTHEQMFGVSDGSMVERNIFIGKSYGAIMGIDYHNAAHTLIRNNTIDMRGSGDGVIFHITNPLPSGVVIRNNIFMRCNGIHDEQSTQGAITYLDYNLYASVGTRYQNVLITGKTPGSDGYDMHALPASGALVPADVVVNPDSGYPFPYSDSDMISGAKTFDQALSYYRTNYSLKAGSPAINAGAPQDSLDSLVMDKRCDMGAVEYTGPVAVAGKYSPVQTVRPLEIQIFGTGYKAVMTVRFAGTGNYSIGIYTVSGKLVHTVQGKTSGGEMRLQPMAGAFPKYTHGDYLVRLLFAGASLAKRFVVME